MRKFISRGLALMAILTSMTGLTVTAGAQSTMTPEPSFAPAGGIKGAVPNLAAYGLSPVALVNGVPTQAVAPQSTPVLATPVVATPVVATPPRAKPPVRVRQLSLALPFRSRPAFNPLGAVRMQAPLMVPVPVMVPRPVMMQAPVMMRAPVMMPAPVVRHAPMAMHEPVVMEASGKAAGPLVSQSAGAAPTASSSGLNPILAQQPHCRGFARASDGSLVATRGGTFESMIIGATCEDLIRDTLRAGQGIVLAASVLFDGSSDTISLTAKRALGLTAEAIDASGGHFEVVGYASRDGDRIANDYLSWRRAKAAAYFLIHKGVATHHLSIIGKGETTKFGPALAVNRRVVIRRKA